MHPIAIIALISATLFAGAAAYISLVEHPARMCLDDGAALAQWKPSYAKALPLQSGLAVLGGVLGLVAWYLSRDGLWLAGSVAILANWPFTLLGIMPTNTRLQAIGAGPESRQMLIRWGKLHAIRSMLGAASTLLYAVALNAL